MRGFLRNIKGYEDMKKKIMALTMVLLYVTGTTGGILFNILDGALPVAVGVAALAWMAWPKCAEYRDRLIDE